MKTKIKKYSPEILGSLLCLILGMCSGYGVKSSSIWYTSLIKPVFNPPSWLFGPVWTLLYLMMGVALGKLWKQKTKNKQFIFIFVIQFIFNLLWTPIFFCYHYIGLAFLDLCALFVLLAVLLFAVRHQKSIMLLLLPYFLWVTFAGILNFSIYYLNRL